VNKAKARNEYNKGKTIFIAPKYVKNTDIDSIWWKYPTVSKEFGHNDFNQFVVDYEKRTKTKTIYFIKK